MSVKSKVLSAGVLFFLGGQMMLAQKAKNDTVQKEKEIETVVVQGLRTVTKKTSVGAAQTIKSEVLENRPQTNVMNAVQGQLAGVNIASGTGQPGAKPSVIIRGAGTLSGNTDPLYIIDGFPSNADSFRSLNGYDIESMEVLKDPSALSEYGNRASNGVIVIKTKRGAIGRSRLDIRYNTQTGVSVLQSHRYNHSNAKELLYLQKRAGEGIGVSMTNEEIEAEGEGTYWMNYFFKPSFMTSHNLSFENSGKNHSNYTSAGYLDQQGVLQGTSLKRFTFRNNLSGRSENNKLKYYAGLSAAFSNNRTQDVEDFAGGVNQNPVLGALMSVPYVHPSMYQGSQSVVDYYLGTGGNLSATPLMLMDKLETAQTNNQETRIDANTELSYQISHGLTSRLRANATYNSNRILKYQMPNSFNSLLFSPTRWVSSQRGGAYNGFEDFDTRENFAYNNLAQLEYKKSIGKHTFILNGSFEYNYFNYRTSFQRQRGLNPQTYVPGAGTGYVADTNKDDRYVPTIRYSQLRLNMLSYIGSFDYDFGKKYGVVASIRRDGTSRFVGDYRYGNFWSIGGRWNIDEEDFIKDVEFINTLKLRGSYGTVGNQRIIDGITVFTGLVPPRFMDTYEIVNNTYNAQLGYKINFGAYDLRWETTKSYNVGMDFEFFKRRLRGSVDVYEKKTEDMFYTEPVSHTVGARTITRNTSIGLFNRGIEVNFAYDILRKSNLTLTLRGNGAVNKQEVFGIIENNGIIQEGENGYLYRTQNGHVPFATYLYDYVGVNPETGNLWFRKADGSLTENPTEQDRVLAKYNHLPKYQGGFGFDFKKGGFFVSTTFTFVAGILRYDGGMESAYDPTSLAQFNVSADLLNAWTPDNKNAYIPSLKAANLELSAQSNRFLFDASYLRLRNLQVGYEVPKSFLRDTFVKGMTVSIQAENLYTLSKWRGFDPESTRRTDINKYPTPRIYTLGFDIKF